LEHSENVYQTVMRKSWEWRNVL